MGRLTPFRATAWTLALVLLAPAVAEEEAFPRSTARRVYELIETLKRPHSSSELQEALDELVACGPAITPLVLQELDKHDRYTYVPMIYLLGRIGNRSTRALLWDISRREHGVVGHWAHYALAMQGEVAAVREVVRRSSATASFAPGGTAADFVAGVLGPPAVPALIEELPNRAGPGLVAGLTALGTLADPRATPFLLSFLESDDPSLQRVALAALARIGAPEAAAPATRLLASEDPMVREAAAETLSYLKWGGALGELRRLAAGDPSSGVRAKAVWALGKIGGAAAVSTLAAVARSQTSHDLRGIAVQALGETGTAEAAGPLEEIALGHNEALAPLAIGSLDRLALPAATGALERTAARAAGPALRSSAVQALADRRPAEAATLALDLLLAQAAGGVAPPPSLMAVVARGGGAGALHRLEALDAEGSLHPDLEPLMRELRLRVELGDDAAAWRSRLRSEDPREVLLATRRLGELADTGAVADLVGVFGRIEPERSHEVVLALGRIGSPDALGFLRELMADDLYDVPSLVKARCCAAWSVSRCGGGKDTIPALTVMAGRGGEEAVYALVALARIQGEAALDQLYELKRNILRRVSAEAVSAHESVNWVIRELRAGRPLDRLDRPPE